MSRNSDYEARQKAKGLKKVTVWIPDSSEVELKQVAQFCCENQEYFPFMVRSSVTGRMKKGI